VSEAAADRMEDIKGWNIVDASGIIEATTINEDDDDIDDNEKKAGMDPHPWVYGL
jgi:hypothetical protein